MKLLRASLSLLLAVLLLQMVPLTFAQEYDERKIATAEALSGMSFAEQETVTRAQFANLLAESMTGGEYGASYPYFTDVNEKSSSYRAVSYLAGMGIIVGDSGKFYPENAIKKTEAVKMAVMALGYRQPAENKGGYYTGYLALGARLKLLANVDSGEILNGRDAMLLMYHTMHADMLEVRSFSGDDYTGKVGERNFLEHYRGIYKISGKMTASRYIGLGDSKATGRNAVTVGGLTLENCAAEYDRLIGQKVDAYYTDHEGECEAVYISSLKRGYEMYPAEQISNRAQDHTMTAMRLSESNETVKISQYADFIFNGRRYDAMTAADFAFDDGYVELIDNGSGEAEVVIINSIQYARVSAVDEMANCIYTVDGTKIDLHAAESYRLTNENGAEISLSEVVCDDLLEIAASKDSKDKLLQIKRVRSTLAGKIVLSDKGEYGKMLLGVGDQEYKTTRAFAKSAEAAEAVVGKYAVFYFNSLGEIASMKCGNGEDLFYGYLLEADQGRGISADTKLKIYTQENKCMVYPLADKVKTSASAQKQSKKDVLTSLMSGGRAQQQMIRFSLNEDGEINRLYQADTITEYDGSSDFYRLSDDEYTFYNASKLLYSSAKSKAYYVGNAVVYFNVLRDLAKRGKLSETERLTEDDLYVSYAPNMVDGSRNYASIYDFGYAGNAACVISEPKSMTDIYDNNLVLVNDIRQVMDENGEMTIRIYGWKKSQKIIYEPSELMKSAAQADIDAMREGDALVATFDRRKYGLLENIKISFSAQDSWRDGIIPYIGSSDIASKQVVTKGTVYDLDGSALCLEVNGMRKTLSVDHVTNFYIYHSDNKTYTPSTGGEIRKSREGGNGSRVVVYSRYGEAYDVIVVD